MKVTEQYFPLVLFLYCRGGFKFDHLNEVY